MFFPPPQFRGGYLKSDFLYTIFFFALFLTHQYTIFKRKAPNFDQIGCFLQWFAQNIPSWASSSLMKPAIAIPNFAKKHPKRQAHTYMYVYHVNVRYPPRPQCWWNAARHDGLVSNSRLWCWHRISILQRNEFPKILINFKLLFKKVYHAEQHGIYLKLFAFSGYINGLHHSITLTVSLKYFQT